MPEASIVFALATFAGHHLPDFHISAQELEASEVRSCHNLSMTCFQMMALMEVIRMFPMATRAGCCMKMQHLRSCGPWGNMEQSAIFDRQYRAKLGESWKLR
jgi:hypothetical protein